MKYALGYIDCKVSYEKRMQLIWVRQKLGDELFKEINQDWCEIELVEELHPTLPDDLFKRVNIFVKVDQSYKQALLFPVKYGEFIERTIC